MLGKLTDLSLRSLAGLLTVFLLAGKTSTAQAAGPAKSPVQDILVFRNGDKLTGVLESVSGGVVVFKSDGAGELKIPWKNIKELHAAERFAVIVAGVRVRPERPNRQVPLGTIDVSGTDLTVHTESGTTVIPVDRVNYVVPAEIFRKSVYQLPGILGGWAGSISAGASLVESTQTLSTFNSSISLVRTVPSTPWLAPEDRSILGFTSTFGSISQPNTPTVETSIYHGNAEQDKYFTQDFYGLAQAIFDHNSTQGLDLQQIYGAGFGYTLFKNTNQELDVTGTLSYTNQQFQDSSADQNLIGATFADNYFYRFANNVLLTEYFSITPQFNNINAYFANLSLGVVVPMYHQLAFSMQIIDTYLNNPSPGFMANSLQLNAGLTYTLPQKGD